MYIYISKTAGAMIRHRACIVSRSLMLEGKIRNATATRFTTSIRNAYKQAAFGTRI